MSRATIEEAQDIFEDLVNECFVPSRDGISKGGHRDNRILSSPTQGTNWYGDDLELLKSVLFRARNGKGVLAEELYEGGFGKTEWDNDYSRGDLFLAWIAAFYCVAANCDGTEKTAGSEEERFQWVRDFILSSPRASYHLDWEREDYHRLTIGKAMMSSDRYYSGFNSHDPIDASDPSQTDYFKVHKISDLRQLPKIEWLIDGVLQKGGYSCTFGLPESGKSLIGLDQALCVASGKPWHGRAVLPGKALYIAAEGQEGIQQRVEAWLREHQVNDVPNIGFCFLPVYFMEPRNVEKLVRDVREQWETFLDGNNTLIIIDTLADCMTGDENRTGDMTLFVRGMKELSRSMNSTINIIHHSGKNKESGARGSNVLLASATGMYYAEQPRDGIHRYTCVKQRNGMKFQPMIFNRKEIYETESVVLVQSQTEIAGAPIKKIEEHSQDFISLLKLSNRPLNRKEIEETLGLRGGSFNRLRKEAGNKVKTNKAGSKSTYEIAPDLV